MNKSKKSSKPPCRICRSRKWRKNSLGFYVCEFGHQMEGFQEEEGEFDANAGSMHHRKLKVKKRKRKVKELTVFVGAHADYLLVQSAQLIFRHQIHDMIHHLGFPPELESVAREYWTLYMSLLTVFQDKWQLSGIKSLSTDTTVNENEMDSDNEHSGTQREQTDVESGQELNPDRFKDKTAAPESRPDQLDTMNEYHDNHDSSEESEIEDDSENDDAVPPSPGVQDEDLPEEENGNDGSKTKYRYYRRSNGLKFSMSYLIAICYISAHHLRIPVVFEDFYRWTRDRKIVYYNAVDTLPKEMGCRLVGEQRILLIPKHRKRDVFESATTRLLEWFRKKFGITPPRANMPPFVFRFIQELMLPVEIYSPAIYQSKRLFATITRLRKATYLPIGHWKMGYNPPVIDPIYAMAIVIIMAKFLFSLDGKSRAVGDPLSWPGSLPREDQWLRMMDIYDSAQAQTTVPVWSGEFEELIQVNPDLYAEYVKNEMRPPSKPKPIISSVLEFFQETTGYPQESEKYSGQDQISPALEAFIKKLYSSAILPDEETSIDPHRPPPLRLGEGFVHYKADHLSNYLGNYGRVLSYGCEVLGIDPNVLQQEISAVEDLLFKNQPKQIRVTAI